MINKCQGIPVCFAVDDNYAAHLAVTIRSIMRNRNRELQYDIIVLYEHLSANSKDMIQAALQNEKDVIIRFVDVSGAAKPLQYDVGAYLSIATNYRLLLFSDMFAKYDRMIYLDCDVIVQCDIAELYSLDIGNKPIAAVRDAGMRQLSYCKKAVFINGCEPYNVDNYRTDALGMKHPEDYFNAGVLLVDLKKSREVVEYREIVDTLQRKNYHFNDQDTLNIVFDGRVYLLDVEWNYQNNIEAFSALKPDVYGPMYADVRREAPKLIHYVGSCKPWDREAALGDIYHRYEE